MAINTYFRLPGDRKDEAIPLLVEVLKEQPYNVELWFHLADYFTGSYENVGRGGKRYPRTCPDPKFDDLRADLLTLANEELMSKGVLPVTYVEVITRITNPASCCGQGESSESLKAAASAFEEGYSESNLKPKTIRSGLAVFQAHLSVCVMNMMETVDNPVQAVWEILEPLLIEEGSEASNEALENFLDHESTLDELVKFRGNAAYEELIPLLEELKEEIPKIQVGIEKFALSPQYTSTCDRLKNYYSKVNNGSAIQEELDDQNNELLESLKTASPQEWQTLVDNGKVMGHYEGLVNGTKVYDETQDKIVDATPAAIDLEERLLEKEALNILKALIEENEEFDKN